MTQNRPQNFTFGHLDQVPVGLCVLRDDFIVAHWNRFIESWTGVPSEEMIGAPLGSRFAELLAPEFLDCVQQALSGRLATPVTDELVSSLFIASTMRVERVFVSPIRSRNNGSHAVLSIHARPTPVAS